MINEHRIDQRCELDIFWNTQSLTLYVHKITQIGMPGVHMGGLIYTVTSGKEFAGCKVTKNEC